LKTALFFSGQSKIKHNPNDDISDCDIAILTVSFPHNMGMERAELLSKNTTFSRI